MPRFENREEYERWKAERLAAGGEKGPSGNDREGQKGPEEAPRAGRDSTEGAPGPSAAGGKDKGGGGLPEVEDLFSRAWRVYKARFCVLAGLILFSFLIFGCVLALFGGSGYLLSAAFPDQKTVLLAVFWTLGAAASVWLLFLGGAAVTFAVADEKLGFRDALSRAKGRVCSFIWISSLIGFIVTGGFLLFFVPGLIFSVWFAFPLYIFAKEGEAGMNALLKSREYVRDQWFQVFLRLFLVWILSAVVGAVPLVGPFLSIGFAPYMLIFAFLLYQDLAALKGDVTFEASGGRKCGLIALGGLGYIVAPAVIVLLVGASLAGILMLLGGLITGGSGSGPLFH